MINNKQKATPDDSIMAFDDEDFEDVHNDDQFIGGIDENEEATLREAVSDFQLPADFDAQDFDTENLKSVNMGASHATANLTRVFLEEVKEEYDLHGCGYATFVLAFPRKCKIDRITRLKKAFTVRLSRVRQAAQANNQEVPKFYAMFLNCVPIEPDESGAADQWLMKMARMGEVHYRAYRKLQAEIQQNNADNSVNNLLGIL